MNLIFAKQQLLMVKNGDSYFLPEAKQLIGLNYCQSKLALDGISILGWVIPDELINMEHSLELVPLRQAFTFIDSNLFSQLIYAQQLIYYQQTHRFCGSCGAPTCVHANKWLFCNNCQEEIYPRISPAMIVRIERDDEILMVQAQNFPPQTWGLVAGFSEIGESLEQTVIREVREEVGIEITNLCYWGSQYWPFPNSMMVGFTANYLSGELKIDPVELRQAGFFKRDNLPGLPSTKLSIAYRMIDEWLQQA